VASIEQILLLLRDGYRVFQTYANPINSHALQVYHSVLATGPFCSLLDYMRSGQRFMPRLISQRTSDWSFAVQGHTGDVNSVAYSPDGTRIASGSDDMTVRIWDAHTGKELAVLHGHRDWVRSVAFSPDGTHIVSGSDDDTVRVWDAHTGKPPVVLEGHTYWVLSVAFSPDGGRIVSGSYDKTVRMWDAVTGKQLAVLEGHHYQVISVAFSADGKRITSRDESGAELAWNATSALLHQQFLIRVVAHTLSDASEFTSVEGQITHVPRPPTEALVWNENSGWISWRRSRTHSVRLCWLPHECCGSPFASHNMTAAIGARHAAVTILDFSEVIAMLDTIA
jgi:WD40 repeat protein